MIEIINTKLDNKNLDFTKEEQEYIIAVPELFSKLVNIILHNKLDWTKSFYQFWADKDLELLIDAEFTEELLYSSIKASIKYEFSSIEDDDYYGSLILSCINRKDYQEELYETLSLIEKTANMEMTDYRLLQLATNEEYSKIAENTNNLNCESTTIEHVLKKYPCDIYGFPNSFLNYYNSDIMNPDVLSIPQNIFLNYNSYYATKANSNMLLASLKKKLDKIIKEQHIENINLNNYNTFSELFNLSLSHELIEYTCNNSDTFYLLHLFPLIKDPSIKEKIVNKIINDIKKHDKKTISLINQLDVLYFNILILNSPQIYDVLLEEHALKKIYIYPETLDNYKLINNICNYLKKYPEVELNFLAFDNNNVCDYSRFKILDTCNKLNEKKYQFFNINDSLLLKEIIKKIKYSFEFTANIISCRDNTSNYLISNRLIRDAILSRNDITTNILIKKINALNGEVKVNNIDLYNKSKEFICKLYNFDINKLEYLANNCGFDIFKYLGDSNIAKILSLDLKDIRKILALFPKEKINLVDLGSYFESIRQYTFPKKNNSIVMSFSNILTSLNDNNDDYLVYIKYIGETLDNKENERFIRKFCLNHNLDNLKANEILSYIVINIKRNQDKQKYIDMLKELTDRYIEMKRKKYCDINEMYNLFYIPYIVLDKDKILFLTNYCLKESNFALYHFWDFFLEEINKHNIDYSLITETIDFIRNPNKKDFKNDLNLIKKNVILVKNIASSVVSERLNYILDDELAKRAYDLALDRNKIKKSYFYNDDNNKPSTYEYLTKLRLDIITDKLLNTKAYDSLLEVMQKRKLHLIPDFVKDFINHSNLDIDCNNDAIAAYINYYYRIYENNDKENDNMSLSNILKWAKVYLAHSSIYSQILTPEDATLIITNPTPNSATTKTSGNLRVEEAIEVTINNFYRQEVTIPTFNEIITLNGKKIRCIVGNFTHPSNVTHGERTGSCMRIGGVGGSLFNFALKNPNGFHIRFEDPDTNEYISRVTGFRNGNTVFLNELRNSLDPDKYTNEDIVDFCQNISQKLIQYSKDDPTPIDNVIIHRDYAMKNSKFKETNLDVPVVDDGLPTFYHDVNNYDIILATSKQDNSLVPINFDKTNLPSYLPAREEILESDSITKIGEHINRIHAINSYIKTKNYQNIEGIVFEKGFVYGICNEDFYIYLDKEGNLHEEIINIDLRAYEELSSARNKIKNKFKLEGESHYAR